jgi:hypothetical protein
MYKPPILFSIAVCKSVYICTDKFPHHIIIYMRHYLLQEHGAFSCRGYTHSPAVSGDIVDREGMVEAEAPGERLVGGREGGRDKGREGRKREGRIQEGYKRAKSQRKEMEGEKWTFYTDQRVS